MSITMCSIRARLAVTGIALLLGGVVAAGWGWSQYIDASQKELARCRLWDEAEATAAEWAEAKTSVTMRDSRIGRHTASAPAADDAKSATESWEEWQSEFVERSKAASGPAPGIVLAQWLGLSVFLLAVGLVQLLTRRATLEQTNHGNPAGTKEQL